ncbi:MAG: Asp-tRNA(Asn)/Glu-tRNA(Gln) amidotransferase subunit GatC [Elusimicrobia bacterium]|nr:Asp-tRNA(Asn)/Glu-tRNA(Gln) amidotransferase subunit GatC [Elusimicrobiota bacterium]
MEITEKDVEYIAELARLELTSEEKRIYQTQLKNILDWMEMLNQTDTSKVQPAFHAACPPEADGTKEDGNVLRDDRPVQSENREDILKNAPDREFDFIKVKKVIE